MRALPVLAMLVALVLVPGGTSSGTGWASAAMSAAAPSPRGTDPPAALALVRRTPDRLGVSATFELTVPAALAGTTFELSVFDPTGRRVRVLDRGLARAGQRLIDWDQKDDTGRRVRPGVYFVSFRTAGHFVAGRVAVVR